MPGSSSGCGRSGGFQQPGEFHQVRPGEPGSTQPDRVRQLSRQDAGIAVLPPSAPVRAPASAGAESATRDRQAAAGTASAIRPRAAVVRARATGTVSAAATP